MATVSSLSPKELIRIAGNASVSTIGIGLPLRAAITHFYGESPEHGGGDDYTPKERLDGQQPNIRRRGSCLKNAWSHKKSGAEIAYRGDLDQLIRSDRRGARALRRYLYLHRSLSLWSGRSARSIVRIVIDSPESCGRCSRTGGADVPNYMLCATFYSRCHHCAYNADVCIPSRSNIGAHQVIPSDDDFLCRRCGEKI